MAFFLVKVSWQLGQAHSLGVCCSFMCLLRHDFKFVIWLLRKLYQRHIDPVVTFEVRIVVPGFEPNVARYPIGHPVAINYRFIYSVTLEGHHFLDGCLLAVGAGPQSGVPGFEPNVARYPIGHPVAINYRFIYSVTLEGHHFLDGCLLAVGAGPQSGVPGFEPNVARYPIGHPVAINYRFIYSVTLEGHHFLDGFPCFGPNVARYPVGHPVAIDYRFIYNVTVEVYHVLDALPTPVPQFWLYPLWLMDESMSAPSENWPNYGRAGCPAGVQLRFESWSYDKQMCSRAIRKCSPPAALVDTNSPKTAFLRLPFEVSTFSLTFLLSHIDRRVEQNVINIAYFPVSSGNGNHHKINDGTSVAPCCEADASAEIRPISARLPKA
ncbi:hypothetical protein BU15DRAFT_66020 [Melanogaster broomeanus]|nr:hypothetical protein BU15DRAFT_66020 [Melanogaster broomeanus]